MSNGLPPWAGEMRDLFKSGSVAQFILHGAIFDWIPSPDGKRLLSLQEFLDEVMFPNYDVVLRYDRGRGMRVTRGGEDWGRFLEQVLGAENVTLQQLREPGSALELIDRYLLRTLNLRALSAGDAGASGNPKESDLGGSTLQGSGTSQTPPRPPAPSGVPQRIAVVIEFAEFVIPRGEALSLGGAFASNVVKVLGWANDPAVLRANIVTVLVSEGLHDLNELVVENPHAASLHIPLPNEKDMQSYLATLAETQLPDLASKSEVTIENLARRMTGLSRVGARTVLRRALEQEGKVTNAFLTAMKKDAIERECQGLLEFLESPYTLEHVAGHEAIKLWLREDTQLLRKGALHALPMGYLITGRIGTGKTFLIQCWAGELGIPCVVFKNFRDRWVGATESNLEKIFAVLRALGQVVVFVDEADQAAGKREGGDGDSGLSGRVYSMLAKEMSDTRNRGRILWVFATSRPDLLEVDLKRQGRLDVHMPLFPPETSADRQTLLLAVAKKFKFPLRVEDLPPLPDSLTLGGNEMEAALVRALRIYELSAEPKPLLKDLLAGVFTEMRPSAHTRKLEYMDLVAVKECTDARFLPERFRTLSPEALESRIAELRPFV